MGPPLGTGGFIASQMKTLQRSGEASHFYIPSREPGKPRPAPPPPPGTVQSDAPYDVAPPVRRPGARSYAAPHKHKVLKDQVDKIALKKTLWASPRKAGRSGHGVFRKLNRVEPMKNV